MIQFFYKKNSHLTRSLYRRLLFLGYLDYDSDRIVVLLRLMSEHFQSMGTQGSYFEQYLFFYPSKLLLAIICVCYGFLHQFFLLFLFLFLCVFACFYYDLYTGIPVACNILYIAMWNWMHNRPREFVELFRKGERLCGGVETIFRFLHSHWKDKPNSMERIRSCWPVMTLLIFLCPDIFGTVSRSFKSEFPMHSAGKQSSKFSSSNITDLYSDFLLHLVDVIVHPKQSAEIKEIALTRFVEIFRLSTFGPKSTFASVRLMIPEIQGILVVCERDSLLISFSSQFSICVCHTFSCGGGGCACIWWNLHVSTSSWFFL